MQVVVKKLSELKKPEKNVRIHTDKQIDEYIRSIKMFGQIRPMVVDENNVILAGNGLYEAMTKMGLVNADCYVVSGLNENQKKKLMLSDNKVFELGMNDMDTFEEFLKDLGQDIDVPGYDIDLLKVLNSTPIEADTLISSYGVYSQEEVEYQHNKGSYEEVPENNSHPYVAPEAPMQAKYTSGVQAEVHDEGKYIICPKCGEKIWL